MNLILGVGVSFPRFGRFEFVLRVDNYQVDSWAVQAAQHPASPAPQAARG